MKVEPELICPCSSGKKYAECCQPYHEGKQPESPIELVRSRFAAFALNKPDYIIKTTHPANPQYTDNFIGWKRQISEFAKNTQFNKLEILDRQDDDIVSSVTFTAHITQEGQDASFTETSSFEKFRGKWLYRMGKFAKGRDTSIIPKEKLKILPLAYYGEAVLRKKGEPVKEINDEIKKLVEQMISTMDFYNGVGIAAPQVHKSLQLFVIRNPIEDNEGSYDVGDVEVFINPKLFSPGEENWTESEGCLSIPGLRWDVERPHEIKVEYTNLEGKRITETISGWRAKVIMHENDHINGVLYVDRLPAKDRAKIEQYLKKLEKRMHQG